MSGMPVPRSQTPQKVSNQAITDLFASGPSSTPSTPQIVSPPPSTKSSVQAQPPRSPDPFAALTSTPRQGSPFQYQQSIKAPTTGSAAVDLLGGDMTAPSSNLAQSSTSAANDDDEWTFASSVPDTTNETTVLNTNINVIFNVSRETDTSLLIQSRISNNTPLPISGLTLQLAASKVNYLCNNWLGHYILTLNRAHNSSWNLSPVFCLPRTRRTASRKTFG
jgi:ADP-ribosylation factor-binding protein GGA